MSFARGDTYGRQWARHYQAKREQAAALAADPERVARVRAAEERIIAEMQAKVRANTVFIQDIEEAKMSTVDQYSWWQDALAGKPVESEVGNPRSGFWKGPKDEPVAIWRDMDDGGRLCCERMYFGGGANMRPDQIDELFSQCSRYPIDQDTYLAARNGEPPIGFKTRLTLKEIEAGVIWSLDLGRKKAGEATKPDTAAENPRAVIGDNKPPEATEAEPAGHKLVGDETPDKVLFAETSALAGDVKRWLGKLKDGKPQTKEDADKLADYATKFGALSKKAEAARKAEKQPHLDAGSAIDAVWKLPKDLADISRQRSLELSQGWREAEDARRIEEVRKANERSAAEAKERGEAKPAEIKAERVGGLGHIKTVAERETVSWIVTDARTYLGHLIAGEGELPAEIIEAAGKVARRRAEAAPGVERKTERKAA